MKLDKIEDQITVIEGVTAKLDGRVLTLSGSKGEVSRSFPYRNLSIKLEGNIIMLLADKATTKREKKMIKTYAAHIRNMIKGASEGHLYKLKICSGHFPMNVSMSGKTFSVKNFLGEKVPRLLKLKEGAEVKIDGEIITVNSSNIELSGQVAADIEQLTRITNKDIRIFQDGIYIIEKSGKAL